MRPPSEYYRSSITETVIKADISCRPFRYSLEDQEDSDHPVVDDAIVATGAPMRRLGIVGEKVIGKEDEEFWYANYPTGEYSLGETLCGRVSLPREA